MKMHMLLQKEFDPITQIAFTIICRRARCCNPSYHSQTYFLYSYLLAIYQKYALFSQINFQNYIILRACYDMKINYIFVKK